MLVDRWTRVRRTPSERPCQSTGNELSRTEHDEVTARGLQWAGGPSSQMSRAWTPGTQGHYASDLSARRARLIVYCWPFYAGWLSMT